MSYQTELQRLVEAKASMRQSIINKGVEVPEDVMIEDLPEYIAQISAVIPVTPPDLSGVLTAADLSNIQNIVGQGLAAEYFSLGDQLNISYGSYTMPFEVVGFNDVEIEGGKTVKSLNLLAKYTSEVDSTWGENGSTKYSASTLRTSITTAYQNNLSADFVACLANTKVQTYSRDGSTDIVYDKLFAPSMSQLGVTATEYNNANQAAVEGTVFTAYQGANKETRRKYAINATTKLQDYWTSSLYSGDSNRFGFVDTSGAPGNSSYSIKHRIVAACNLIGKGGN